MLGLGAACLPMGLSTRRDCRRTWERQLQAQTRLPDLWFADRVLSFTFTPAQVPQLAAPPGLGRGRALAAGWRSKGCHKSKSARLGPRLFRFHSSKMWHKKIKWSRLFNYRSSQQRGNLIT